MQRLLYVLGASVAMASPALAHASPAVRAATAFLRDGVEPLEVPAAAPAPVPAGPTARQTGLAAPRSDPAAPHTGPNRLVLPGCTGCADDLTAGCAGGGGRGAPVPAGVCFVLGVIPGLGMGHLLGGDLRGFTTWIVIDVVVLVALTAVTVIVPSPLQWVGWAGYLVLHVFQGFSALDSCGGRNPFEANARARWLAPTLAGTPRPAHVEGPTLAKFAF